MIRKYLIGSGLALMLFGVAALASAECGKLLTESASSSKPRQITVQLEPADRQKTGDYYRGLLLKVLEATEPEYGPCQLADQSVVMNRSILEQAMRRGQGIDILWASTTREREARMRPVKLPLLKGLMSYKLALIRSEDQPRFSQVKGLEDLREFRIGAGLDWPDVEIMRANGLRVSGGDNYDALFKMLAADRFDLMLRSANEIGVEMNAYPSLELGMEQELVVVFPSPVYFFVRNENEGLAQRLELGLRRMMADGSFDAYFYSQPNMKAALERLNLSKRRILYLDNPLLPEDVPLAKPDYWLFPWQQNEGRWRVNLASEEDES
jgi:hypothetical protein